MKHSSHLLTFMLVLGFHHLLTSSHFAIDFIIFTGVLSYQCNLPSSYNFIAVIFPHNHSLVRHSINRYISIFIEIIAVAELPSMGRCVSSARSLVVALSIAPLAVVCQESVAATIAFWIERGPYSFFSVLKSLYETSKGNESERSRSLDEHSTSKIIFIAWSSSQGAVHRADWYIQEGVTIAA